MLLSKQAIAVLRDLQPLTGRGEYVFPSVRGPRRPMSENTVNVALRSLGFDGDTMTGHGFRAMARTILDGVLGFRPDYIEHQLAHAVRDPLGRAYNRTAHLAERRKMMQVWADYLDSLRMSADKAAPMGLRALLACADRPGWIDPFKWSEHRLSSGHLSPLPTLSGHYCLHQRLLAGTHCAWRSAGSSCGR